MSKKFIVAIIIIIFIVLAIISGLYYYFNNLNSNDTKEEKKSSNENETTSNSLEINEGKKEVLNSDDLEEGYQEKESSLNNGNSFNEKIKEADKPNLKESDSKNSDVTINVGDYELRCGKYRGILQKNSENGEVENLNIEITEDNTIIMDNKIRKFIINKGAII